MTTTQITLANRSYDLASMTDCITILRNKYVVSHLATIETCNLESAGQFGQNRNTEKTLIASLAPNTYLTCLRSYLNTEQDGETDPAAIIMAMSADADADASANEQPCGQWLGITSTGPMGIGPILEACGFRCLRQIDCSAWYGDGDAWDKLHHLRLAIDSHMPFFAANPYQPHPDETTPAPAVTAAPAPAAATTATDPVNVAIEWKSYNGRRYSRPWIALVTAWPIGKSPELDFGAYTGNDSGGVLNLAARPGSIIKYGQKDYRKTSGSTNDFAIVEEDGAYRDITPQEARELFQPHLTA